MGARASVSFKDNYQESPVIFSHWGGEEFHDIAQKYIDELKKDIKNKKVSPSSPLARLEASRVAIDFIRYITSNLERIENDYYLCRTENDGDNSDYGHLCINLK